MPVKSEDISGYVLENYNKEAERAVLGACIISRDALISVSDILKPEDFYEPGNKIMYEIILKIYYADKAVDFVTVQEEMKNQGVFDRLGGQPFLAELMGNVTTTVNVGYHAEILREKALRRRLLDTANRIASIAFKPGTDTSEIIEDAEKAIFDLSCKNDDSSPLSLKVLSDATMNKVKNTYNNGGRNFIGYASGFEALDSIISGFQPGSLNIIAARPSMGKTALALNIAQFGGDIENNPCVLIFSLEMSAEQLLQRMYSAQSGVKVSAISNGTMSEFEFANVEATAEDLSRRNIFINDIPMLSATDFRSKCRRFKMQHPDLALIVVDYLQLMHADRKRNDNRQQETADISRMLKAVAIELDCPVLALSQLSREVERRTEKKPQLSDLRDSGAIEQDADTVILLYREDYYGENSQYAFPNNKAEVRVAKNRNGRTGVCNLVFRREYTRFENYAEGY